MQAFFYDEDWRWSSAGANCAACDGGQAGDMTVGDMTSGDMTQMQSEAPHLGS